MLSSAQPVRRALISVSDKTGIVELASRLHARGVDLLSTGGTAKLIAENNIPVTGIADYTSFPEMMEGRVKTLHPKVHGGILARRGIDEDVMKANEIPPIDLVIVNFYPFEVTVANTDCTREDAIENIDIGGPTMVRAAAKNHASVCIAVDPNDYSTILSEMDADDGKISDATRFSLAIKAFEHTASYDGAISNYFGRIVQKKEDSKFPRTINLQFKHAQGMRYGENPHQNAAFYIEAEVTESSISTTVQLQGKALSFNNIGDTDAALECVKQFDQPACVIVKHSNPCGVAVDSNVLNGNIHNAYQSAYKTDPESAFGGIIAFNRTLDAKTAKTIIDQQFVEVIIAPDVDPEANAIIATKQNVRLLQCGQLQTANSRLDYKRVNGGLLVQDTDLQLHKTLNVVTEMKPRQKQIDDMIFALKVAKFVKSNAIVYAREHMTIGIGAGQMSRINSVRIAATKAEHAKLQVKDSVMASDAFFPFRDAIDAAHNAGIQAIIQPGGSMQDYDVIAAANEHGITMIFTGMRHFRH